MCCETMVIQEMRECRWAQPQCPRAAAAAPASQRAWECVRVPGAERPVTDAECERCEHWEPRP
jgi:hypothetical protein